MKAIRFLGVLVYVGYLVQVGLLLLLLPWTQLWSTLVLTLPARLAFVLDAPAVRGVISAFGFLHLVLVVAELLAPLPRRAA